MLSIGEFATLTHLSIRTLRRYHDGGLLEPARVDPATGYRSYSPDQIPTAQVIHQLRAVPATPVAAVEAVVDLDDVLTWYAGAMADLDAVVPAPSAAPGGSYDDALFTVGRGRALVHLPTDAAPTSGRVRPVVLPAVELAVRTHAGDHDTIDVAYGELGRWVAEHALAVAGPVRETYLVGPRDTPDSTAWRTEIGWPVFGFSSSGGRGAAAG